MLNEKGFPVFNTDQMLSQILATHLEQTKAFEAECQKRQEELECYHKKILAVLDGLSLKQAEAVLYKSLDSIKDLAKVHA